MKNYWYLVKFFSYHVNCEDLTLRDNSVRMTEVVAPFCKNVMFLLKIYKIKLFVSV